MSPPDRLLRLLALTLVAVAAGCHPDALSSTGDGGGPDIASGSVTVDSATLSDANRDEVGDATADAAPSADMTPLEVAPMPVDAVPDAPPATLPADAGAPDVADAGCQTECRPNVEWLRV